MTTSTERFQIPPEAAELYEAQFVPGIFAEWAPRLAQYAEVGQGDDVLDVACGTGIVARTVADLVGPQGSVVGLDLNQAMLDVARRVRPDLTWQQGDAATLPFDDESFDVVLCQMALMFMPDRTGAIAEMARVARKRVAVVVPSSLDAQPAYGPFTEVVARHAGAEGASLVGTYWSCGDLEELTGWLRSAGLHQVEVQTTMGTACFASVDALVATEVEGSPLIQRIDDDTYTAIREGCRRELDGFTTTSGAVEAPFSCRLVRGEVV